ncbi:MAG: formimidoylglutamase [Natronospirillum sp.]|uniref:formimidoylglutamase n=1 Tax=Natronospirillum sp. TaxID=2812955 RepID=UPI0025D105DC|nr:formimidoylglutamase [Natronospirillum sp.]MCH8550756.1 formimidoylglutamase [Natronospirillum sp.]
MTIDQTPDMTVWTGRMDQQPDSERWHQQVKPWQHNASPGFALLGFASDEGVRRNQGRIGAAAGPAAIRRALASLAVHDSRPLYDAGDVVCANGDLPGAHERLASSVAQLLDSGQKPMVMGGGHEIAFGTWSGLARHLGSNTDRTPRIGIINFDAHFDLRPLSEAPSSGTPFSQIAEQCRQRGWPFHYACLGVSRAANTRALFNRADELGVVYREDQTMTQSTLPELHSLLDDFMADCDALYLTLCLDVFPAAQVPGVSAPAARGVALDLIEPLLRQIARSGCLAAADIAELNPDYDIDQRSARVAARCLHTLKQEWA